MCTMLFYSSARHSRPDIQFDRECERRIINSQARERAIRCSPHLTLTFARREEIDIASIVSVALRRSPPGRPVPSRNRARARVSFVVFAPIYLLCILMRGFSGILINVNLRVEILGTRGGGGAESGANLIYRHLLLATSPIIRATFRGDHQSK